MEDNYKVSVNDVHSPKHLVTSGTYSGRKNYLDIFGLLVCINHIASHIKILNQMASLQTNDTRYILTKLTKLLQ